MKIDRTASVPMKWDTFEFPIKVGTPVSKYGLLANDGTAFGLIAVPSTGNQWKVVPSAS